MHFYEVNFYDNCKCLAVSNWWPNLFKSDIDFYGGHIRKNYPLVWALNSFSSLGFARDLGSYSPEPLYPHQRSVNESDNLTTLDESAGAPSVWH